MYQQGQNNRRNFSHTIPRRAETSPNKPKAYELTKNKTFFQANPNILQRNLLQPPNSNENGSPNKNQITQNLSSNKSYIEKQHLLPDIKDIDDIGYDQYKIPPNMHIVENYKQASKFGYIVENLGDICNVSHLPLFNRDYDFNSEDEKFDQNGHGYNLFFKFNFFALCILIGIACIPVALVLIGIYKNGKTCKKVENGGHSSFDFLKMRESSHFQEEKVVSEIFEKSVDFFSSTFLESYGEGLCHDVKKELIKEYNDYCKDYRDSGCLGAPQTQDCRTKTSRFYKSHSVSNSCSKSWFNDFSIGNRIYPYNQSIDKNPNKDNPRNIIQHFIYFILIFLILGFQFWMKKYTQNIELKAIENSQIYLILSGFPHGPRHKNYPIAQNIVRLFNHFGFNIVNISFVYDIEDYLETDKELKEEKNEQVKEEYSNSGGGYFDGMVGSNLLKKGDISIADKERKISYYEQLFKNDDPEYMIGKAFIAFDTVGDRDTCFLRSKQDINGMVNQFFLQDGGQIFPLNLEYPEIPDNVIWEDLKYSKTNKFFRKWVSLLLSLAVTFIGFYLLYKLKIYQVSHFFLQTTNKNSLFLTLTIK